LTQQGGIDTPMIVERIEDVFSDWASFSDNSAEERSEMKYASEQQRPALKTLRTEAPTGFLSQGSLQIDDKPFQQHQPLTPRKEL